MSWLTIHYTPGFAHDLTFWTTTIERKGKLRQQVDAWPSRTTVTHRLSLGETELVELARLVEALDFETLADPHRLQTIMEDGAMIWIDVKKGGQVRRFCVPLSLWEKEQSRENRKYLLDLNLEPALALWRVVDRLSPRHLNKTPLDANMDWRLNIEPAVSELRRLRSSGLDLESALDHMRGRGFTLPAVTEALSQVEGIDPKKIHFLLEARGDWDDF